MPSLQAGLLPVTTTALVTCTFLLGTDGHLPSGGEKGQWVPTPCSQGAEPSSVWVFGAKGHRTAQSPWLSLGSPGLLTFVHHQHTLHPCSSSGPTLRVTG